MSYAIIIQNSNYTGYTVLYLSSLSLQDNRIVIMSIHQPRYSIYKEFDTLTLLSLGDLVYHGPTQPVLQHFTEIGKFSLCLSVC